MKLPSKLLALAALGMVSAGPASAGFVIGYQSGNCGDCDQSVNFHGAGSGTTITGNTNPAPVYDVVVVSLDDMVLHGSGQVVDSGPGGAGFNAISLTPALPYAWTYVEFMLAPTTKNHVGGNLTLAATNQNGAVESEVLNFPWEPDNGQNQHYFVQATGGDLIRSLTISYVDADCIVGQTEPCNRIGDIHNIDIKSARVDGVPIPEPGSLALLGLGLAGLGLVRRHRAG
ncbi:PEP-CTERM sorting domain-containing protein [Falsiroseomonas oryzae]|uniref:PEP-CTERM sorting domain-containing protein n=1 Tax=Falsiroseomonas oryzae TaxID=2766473 RepID=UPI0022EB9CE7|nr:PEP-CTERM sorting domain-containing protein [Roseomonas sp. MO-31]